MAESVNSSLRAEKIVDTLEQLRRRIAERFPGSGLEKVCGDLVVAATKTARRVDIAARPNIPLRAVSAVVIIVMLIGLGALGQLLSPRIAAVLGSPDQDITELTQAFESAINLLILAALAIWFLGSLEERTKRRGVLSHLHELRSIAHVVDMHQLTKDPVSILNPSLRTRSSPERMMSEFELARYLDYCTEMLSLTGKLAALYAERTGDPQVVAAATDIENLTSNLGRKIWQKIMMIGRTPPSTVKPADPDVVTPPGAESTGAREGDPIAIG